MSNYLTSWEFWAIEEIWGRAAIFNRVELPQQGKAGVFISQYWVLHLIVSDTLYAI